MLEDLVPIAREEDHRHRDEGMAHFHASTFGSRQRLRQIGQQWATTGT
jgi:hypothetical protein